jgi:glutathionylspermidine synthase
MQRILSTPRPQWRQKVEQQAGLFWHSAKGDYWNESAYYEFTMAEVLKIESVTNELHQRVLDGVAHVLTEPNTYLPKLHIPKAMWPVIAASWEEDVPSLYGRFDLAYDGLSEPRMLEYNADTPTSLVEAALAQWFWLQDVAKDCDQFNSLHERLIAQWKELAPYLQGETVHFVHIDDVEDGMTVTYLRDTANQAGLTTKQLLINDIGRTTDGFFTDLEDQVIECCFKLYPWEWLAHEEYGATLAALGTSMQWIEPAWKQIPSNKAFLPILSELFPDHPNILKASFDAVDTVMMEAFVKKPMLSREGAGVTVTMFDQTLAATPDQGYGEEGYIYQELATVPTFGGKRPIIGSWIIGQEAGGMGIRESNSLVTDNLSQFVPHLIRG